MRVRILIPILLITAVCSFAGDVDSLFRKVLLVDSLSFYSMDEIVKEKVPVNRMMDYFDAIRMSCDRDSLAYKYYTGIFLAYLLDRRQFDLRDTSKLFKYAEKYGVQSATYMVCYNGKAFFELHQFENRFTQRAFWNYLKIQYYDECTEIDDPDPVPYIKNRFSAFSRYFDTYPNTSFQKEIVKIKLAEDAKCIQDRDGDMWTKHGRVSESDCEELDRFSNDFNGK